MRFTYPYVTKKTGETVLVSFPDVPGANTEIAPGDETRDVVRDCLVAALGAYITRKITPPAPSAEPGARDSVTLDIVTSAKVALATAMAAQGVTNVALATRLGVDEKVVRRLLDPDHRCRIDRLEAALGTLGQQLEVHVRPRVEAGAAHMS